MSATKLLVNTSQARRDAAEKRYKQQNSHRAAHPAAADGGAVAPTICEALMPTGIHNDVVIRPAVIAHADWGTHPLKRQMAAAMLTAGSHYRVNSLSPAAPGRLFESLRNAASPGQALLGVDFPIGLPLAYAAAAGITSFTEFLGELGSPPWDVFASVAVSAADISLLRPFYPRVPGGTKRAHLYQALGLTGTQLRRRCEKTDAEMLFWTLGHRQVGKGALAGWHLLAAARRADPGIALWPFDGALHDLLDGGSRVVVTETYPREYYQHFGPRGGEPSHARGQPGRGPGQPVADRDPPRRWSKRRQPDRLRQIPGLLAWADSLRVSWDPAVLRRVEAGFSPGPNGEDEFDAVAGLLAMIGVIAGAIPTGEPGDSPEISTVEGWILGRPS